MCRWATHWYTPNTFSLDLVPGEIEHIGWRKPQSGVWYLKKAARCMSGDTAVVIRWTTRDISSTGFSISLLWDVFSLRLCSKRTKSSKEQKVERTCYLGHQGYDVESHATVFAVWSCYKRKYFRISSDSESLSSLRTCTAMLFLADVVEIKTKSKTERASRSISQLL